MVKHFIHLDQGEDSYAEIFKNPNFKEMRIAQKASDVEKCIRFFIDFKTKDVVIWGGLISHREAIKSSFPIRFKNLKKLFMGTAICDGRKMKFISSDSFDSMSTKEINTILIQIKKHKKWLSKYFSNLDV